MEIPTIFCSNAPVFLPQVVLLLRYSFNLIYKKSTQDLYYKIWLYLKKEKILIICYNGSTFNKIIWNMNNPNPKSIPVRALVTGDKQAGKSALMAQLCDSYINESTASLPTHRSRVRTKNHGSKIRSRIVGSIHWSYWVLFLALTYIRQLPSALICFIVVDLTRHESFEYGTNMYDTNF